MANSRVVLFCRHCGGYLVLGSGGGGVYRAATEDMSAKLQEFFDKHQMGACREDGYLNASDDASDHFMILDGVTSDMFPRTEKDTIDELTERIIRKKAEQTEYWKDFLYRFRGMKSYSDVEHEVNNFLRGYNEAVDDTIAIMEDYLNE